MKHNEQLIVDIITAQPPSDSAWDDPINAVAKATGLITMQARRLVEDLRNRRTVMPFSIVSDGPEVQRKISVARGEQSRNLSTALHKGPILRRGPVKGQVLVEEGHFFGSRHLEHFRPAQ